MSYDLRIWDPKRHAPIPSGADEALETMERLQSLADTRNAALERFGAALYDRYQQEPPDVRERIDIAGFWGSEPRQSTAACMSAVYSLPLASDDATRQMCFVVEAAGRNGLVVFDDETGMCFLPDGTVYPEDTREMWEATLAESKLDPSKQAEPQSDGRSLLQTIAGELFDAIGRGNKRL